MTNTTTTTTTTTTNTARRRRLVGRGAVLLAAAGISLAAVGPVEAKGGDAIRVSGACSTGNWKLKGKVDSGALEVEFEVDTNRVGQMWAVTITDNGKTVFSGSRATLAPSGSFEVERRIPNQAGADRIVATATRNGVTCRGQLTL